MTEKRRFGLAPSIYLVSSVAFLGWFSWFTFTRASVLKNDVDWTGTSFRWLIVLVLVTRLLNSYQGHLLLAAAGCRISFWELFGLNTISGAMNYLPVGVGTASRMHYIKRRHVTGYGEQLALSLIRIFLYCAISGLCGLAAVAVLGKSLWRSPAGFGSLGLLLVPVLFLAFRDLRFEKWLPGVLRELCEPAFRSLRSQTVTMACLWRVAFLTLLELLVVGARVQISYQLLGISIPFSLALLASPVAIFAGIIALAGNGLGLREGLIGLIAKLNGSSFESGALAATVDRFAILVFLVAALPFAKIAFWAFISRRNAARGEAAPAARPGAGPDKDKQTARTANLARAVFFGRRPKAFAADESA